METGGGASPREQMLKQLAAGYDTFMELINNLSEGGKVSGGVVWCVGVQCGRVLSNCVRIRRVVVYVCIRMSLHLSVYGMSASCICVCGQGVWRVV